MNLKTAARKLGVHYQTAYRWVRSGQLLAVKVGAGYEISEAALERFEVQRSLTQRLPARAHETPSAPTATRQPALHTLDLMVDAVTTDARAVEHRAVRMAADTLGDGALLYMRNADMTLELVSAAHHDPESEVNAFTIGRDARSATDFLAHVLDAGETVFLPQVPQREVRRRMHPERHMHVMSAGCYSAIFVPVGNDGVLVMTRDVPGRPYSREDVEVVEAIARRVAQARERAVRFGNATDTSHDVQARLREATSAKEHVIDLDREELADLLAGTTGDESQALALLDLDLVHVACTKGYAVLLGDEPDVVSRAPLATYLPDLELLAPIVAGELDSRSEDFAIANGRATLHVAMVRRADATPWGILVVAHPAADAAGVR